MLEAKQCKKRNSKLVKSRMKLLVCSAGEKSMSELIADRLVKSYSENPTFDEGHT